MVWTFSWFLIMRASPCISFFLQCLGDQNLPSQSGCQHEHRLHSDIVQTSSQLAMVYNSLRILLMPERESETFLSLAIANKENGLTISNVTNSRFVQLSWNLSQH